jgi:hypothetical protein
MEQDLTEQDIELGTVMMNCYPFLSGRKKGNKKEEESD